MKPVDVYVVIEKYRCEVDGNDILGVFINEDIAYKYARSLSNKWNIPIVKENNMLPVSDHYLVVDVYPLLDRCES